MVQNPNDIFVGMGAGTIGTLAFVIVWMLRIQFRNDDKISRLYKRLDEVKTEFVKRDIFEVEKAHLQENHRHLTNQVADIQTDTKSILSQIQTLSVQVNNLILNEKNRSDRSI